MDFFLPPVEQIIRSIIDTAVSAFLSVNTEKQKNPSTRIIQNSLIPLGLRKVFTLFVYLLFESSVKNRNADFNVQ